METTQQATRAGSLHRPVAGNWNHPAQRTEPTAPPNTHSHQTIHRFLVTPADTGNGGAVDGGTLLEWIDQAAHAVAAQWSGRRCVTASVGNIHLDRPIGVGELVELHADLVYTGRSSMHILVTVHSSDPTGANAVKPPSAQSFSSPSTTRASPSRCLRGHRSPCSSFSATARRGFGYGCANASKAPWPPKVTPQRAPPPAHPALRGLPHRRRRDRPRPRRPRHAVDRQAAAACGTKWTGAHILTSYIAGIRFHGPVIIGDAVEVTARIIHTGPRSVHIGVHVTTTNARGRHVVANGVVVVVALDERGTARSVPAWQPDSHEDRRLDRHARHLIELRQFIEPFTTAAADQFTGFGTGSR